jgi:hypothetical protein
MGRHLDKLKALDKIVAKFQIVINELLKISQTSGEKGKPDKELSMFAIAYAYLNYQFAIYLISKFPKAIQSDKVDKDFNDIMEHFNNGDKKKKDDDNDNKKKGFFGWFK